MYGGAQVSGRRTASSELFAGWIAAGGVRRTPPAQTLPVGPGPGPNAGSVTTPLRLALLDRDSGFLLVLVKRMEALAWEHHAFAPSILPKRILAMHFDAVVVDIQLLGAKAWRWLKALSGADDPPAIVVCTASSTVEDRVRALDLGVDDWVTKPCHPEELMARVEAVVRQRRRLLLLEGGSFVVGEVEINRDVFQAYVAGRSLQLTSREFRVLALLASESGKAIEREAIYKHAWGREMAREDRSVDVVIHKLRRKLLDTSPLWHYIHTHSGFGYRLAPSSCAPVRGEVDPRSNDRSSDRDG